MKLAWKRGTALLLVLAIICGLCGCQKGKSIRFTTGLGDKELFKVGDEVCTRQEAMVFVLSQKKNYERSYGKEIWDVKIYGETFSAYMRDNLQDFLAKMKCMVLMADKYKVELNDEEKLRIEQAAETYFEGLPENVIQASGIGEPDVKTVFHDYYVSNKLMKQLTADVSTEISEDEARVITVQQIFLSTENLSAEEKEAKRKTAQKVKEQADAGADFAVLGKNNNESESFELQIGRGDTETQFENVAYALSTGQISEVVETAYGFHVIKCINNYDEQETAKHKTELARKCKEDRFYEYYDAFVKTIVAEYNEKAWKTIDYGQEFGEPQADFYEVYDQYFGAETY